MPNQTEAVLARHWAILVALIVQIGALVEARLVPAGRHQRICHLLRGAESLARRWLMLKAGRQAGTAAPRQSKAVEMPGHSRTPPRAPLFRLLERDPVLQPANFSDQPFVSADAVPACRAAALQAADALVPVGAGLKRRAEALRDVMWRPDHHAARMARWLKRAADKARTACVSLHPLRIGRPPGARRRDRSCQVHAALWWLDTLARESLWPRWGP